MNCHSSRPLALVSLLVLSAPAASAELSITIEAKNQVSVQDTIVELVDPEGDSTAPREVEITQLDKEFSPEISVIHQGSPVLFSNNDPFQHHVYSVSKGNQFDLPLYQGTPARLIEFDNHGVVKLGCNIHDWMLGFVYVAQSQRLVIADASGKIRFSDLPAGDYQLRVWNPRLRNNRKVITQAITLEENDRREQSVTVALREKIRKPPRPLNDGGYDN